MSNEWKIPSSWIWTLTGDIAQVVGGGTPSTNNKQNYENGEIPWITPADLSGYSDKLIAHGKRNITKHGLEVSGAKLLPKGSVLLSSRAPIGYVAIAANPLATNQGFKSFIPASGVVSEYLYYYLQRAHSIVLSFSSGTTFPEISGKNCGLIPFPLAPLSEQRRIVAEIEKQFARLDEGIAALKRMEEDLQLYRASVLKAACEGRIVPTEAALARTEGGEYAPASVLLQRILKQRRAQWEREQLARMKALGKRPKDDKWKEKYDEPEEPNTSNLARLPEGWTWATVEQLNDALRPCAYGVLQPGPDVENGVLLIRVGDIGYGKIQRRNLKRISPDIAAAYPRTNLRGGEVLISLVGAIGRTAVVPPDLAGANTARAVGVIPLSKGINPFWVELWFRNPRKIAEMTSLSHEVARKTLNLEDVRVASVGLPPVTEQKRIVAEVERRLRVIEEMEATVAINLARAEELRRSILQRAFAGRLVPQDHSDEPASQLLERIADERWRKEEADMKEKKRRPRRPPRDEKGPGLFREEPKDIRRALLRPGHGLPVEEAFEYGGFSYEPNDDGEFADVDAFFEQLVVLLKQKDVELMRHPDSVSLLSNVPRFPPRRPRTQR
ncbi:MAG: restriction endonuclease subunit S [Pyrinomonadaceae bacterium]|nr:restriction endonuclease subunit S [Pyrinomonadaceae bacterium]